MTAFNATNGQVTICIDSTYSSPSVPVGVYDFQNRAFIQSNNSDFAGNTSLTLPSGAVLKDVAAFQHSITIIANSNTVPCLQISNGQTLFITNQATIVNSSANPPAPLIQVGANEYILIIIDNGFFDNTPYPYSGKLVDLSTSTSIATIYTKGSFAFNYSDIVSGVAGSTVIIECDSHVGTLPIASGSFLGTFDLLLASQSKYTNYNDALVSPPFGTSQVQGALDTIKLNKADKSTTISAGTGLTGGGDLSANRTISLAAVGSAGAAPGAPQFRGRACCCRRRCH